jgi:hypothetical protein
LARDAGSDFFEPLLPSGGELADAAGPDAGLSDLRAFWGGAPDIKVEDNWFEGDLNVGETVRL